MTPPPVDPVPKIVSGVSLPVRNPREGWEAYKRRLAEILQAQPAASAPATNGPEREAHSIMSDIPADREAAERAEYRAMVAKLPDDRIETVEQYEAERAEIVRALSAIPMRPGMMMPYSLPDRIRWLIARLRALEEAHPDSIPEVPTSFPE